MSLHMLVHGTCMNSTTSTKQVNMRPIDHVINDIDKISSLEVDLMIRVTLPLLISTPTIFNLQIFLVAVKYIQF